MLRETAVKYAFSLLGLPYRWGGDDTINGFDCSGLVQEILAGVGLDPAGDQTAQQLFASFRTRVVPLPGPGSDQQKVSASWPAGVLLFFGKSQDSITHIGFGIGDGLMIEAGGGGSKTISESAAAEQNAFVRIRPILKRADLVGVVDPFTGRDILIAPAP
jgi:cell wall-associated NlpC family hydrolase